MPTTQRPTSTYLTLAATAIALTTTSCIGTPWFITCLWVAWTALTIITITRHHHHNP